MSSLGSVVGWDLDPVVADWPGLAPLSGDTTADACVVGLGGSGLAAVQELLDRGLTVVGLDAGRVAAGAAGRNGGLLSAGGARDLHQASRSWGAEAAVGLYRATAAERDRLAEDLGPGVVRHDGCLRLAASPAEVDDCARHEGELRRFGVAVEHHDGQLGIGLLVPDDARVNPARRIVATATAIVDRTPARRVRLHERTPAREVGTGRVATDRGTVTAGLVLVAVDGRLEVLLPALAGHVRTGRLQMLMTAPGLPVRLPCAVSTRWGWDYAQQGTDGRLFVGGGRDRALDTEWTVDAEPTGIVQDHIDTVARDLAGPAAASVTVTHRWAASAGFTADGRALCTRVEDGLYAVGGYSGCGNLVGPVAARAAVAAAVDGTPVPAWFTDLGRGTP